MSTDEKFNPPDAETLARWQAWADKHGVQIPPRFRYGYTPNTEEERTKRAVEAEARRWAERMESLLLQIKALQENVASMREIIANAQALGGQPVVDRSLFTSPKSTKNGGEEK